MIYDKQSGMLKKFKKNEGKLVNSAGIANIELYLVRAEI